MVYEIFSDMTATAARTRAHLAATLTCEALPARVAGRAKDCLIDPIVAATFGARFPWSKRVADYARPYGGGELYTVTVMQPQCSVPFCVAVALHRHPDDPNFFAAGALEGPAIRATCRDIESSVWSEPGQGLPTDPLTWAGLKRKFNLLYVDMETAAAEAVFARWAALETQASVRI